jgi:phosphate transport system substrate-binding protein
MELGKLRTGLLLAGALTLSVALAGAGGLKVDSKLPSYKKTSGVSGDIKSTGSDTMNNLMTLWAEGFKRMYPNVEVEIEGKGSSTAPPSLIEGTSIFGPMSRKMKSKEQDAFEKKFGYKAVQLPTSIDMLAVYVHKDNPIAKKGLSLQKLDAAFFKTRKLGYAKNIKTWGDLGLTGEWAKLPISLYGRNAASGTYGYFKKHVGGKGDYKDEVKEQPGSSAVVQGVAKDKGGIGYSGIGYKTADVAVVPLARNPNDTPVPATPDRVNDYPLARFLFLTVNRKPKSQLDPLRREFIKFIFSRKGQQIVIKDGYLPLPFAICKTSCAKVGISLPERSR